MNSTVVGNQGNWALNWNTGGSMFVTNSIFYGNNNNGEQIPGSTASVVYSCIQGGFPGEGNIAFNPALCPDNLSLLNLSPCVDAGHPGLMFRDGCVSNDECSPYARGGSRNDMGAYGGPGGCRWTGPCLEPEIRIDPVTTFAGEGTNSLLSVLATGKEPLTYQWYFGQKAVDGATNAIYEIRSVALSQQGDYRVDVQNASGSASSRTVQLLVCKVLVSAGIQNGRVRLTIRNGVVGKAYRILRALSPAPMSQYVEVGRITSSGPLTLWDDAKVLQDQTRFYCVEPAE
jgi:hypothetical protein